MARRACQRWVAIVNIHSIGTVRNPARDTIHPSIEERKAIGRVRAAKDSVIELELEDCIAVSIGCCVVGYRGDVGVLTAVEINNEVPGAVVGFSCGEPL